MKKGLIDKFAWIGKDHVQGPVRGLILEFAGLGGTGAMKTEMSIEGKQWAAAGGLVIYPYYNPWAWMSQATVEFVDDLIDAIIAEYGLDTSLPLIVTGWSMGGHGALMYTINSRHKIDRCFNGFGASDLLYHYAERPDLPRTLHCALGSYEDITEKLIANSPVHQARRLPDIPYLVMHGDADDIVSKAPHSDKLCALMKQIGRRFTYIEVPGMGHGGQSEAITQQIIDFVKEGLR